MIRPPAVVHRRAGRWFSVGLAVFLIAWEFALLPLVMSTNAWGEAARRLFL